MFNRLRQGAHVLARRLPGAQSEQIRFLNIHEYQGAELMGKYGVNVPHGVAIKSLEEVPAAAEKFADDKGEVVVKSQILAGGRGLGTFKNGFEGGCISSRRRKHLL
eukprot:jgi/Picre1/27861/NNA_000825.t1